MSLSLSSLSLSPSLRGSALHAAAGPGLSSSSVSTAYFLSPVLEAKKAAAQLHYPANRSLIAPSLVSLYQSLPACGGAQAGDTGDGLIAPGAEAAQSRDRDAVRCKPLLRTRQQRRTRKTAGPAQHRRRHQRPHRANRRHCHGMVCHRLPRENKGCPPTARVYRREQRQQVHGAAIGSCTLRAFELQYFPFYQCLLAGVERRFSACGSGLRPRTRAMCVVCGEQKWMHRGNKKRNISRTKYLFFKNLKSVTPGELRDKAIIVVYF